MPHPDIAVGASVTITDGPFVTLRATITEFDASTQRGKGVIEVCGRHSTVELTFTDTPSELRVTAVGDRS